MAEFYFQLLFVNKSPSYPEVNRPERKQNYVVLSFLAILCCGIQRKFPMVGIGHNFSRGLSDPMKIIITEYPAPNFSGKLKKAVPIT